MRKRHLATGRLVVAHWRDSCSSDRWKQKEDLEGQWIKVRQPVKTVGFVIGQTDDCLSLASSLQIEDFTFCCSISIPWGTIVRVSYLDADPEIRKALAWEESS